MKLSEVLQLDLRVKGNSRIFKDKLSELPFFKGEEPDIDDLETAVRKMQKKYPIMLSYIMSSSIEEQYWSAMIKETEKHQHIKTVYGMTLFETLGKTALFLYAYIQKNFK